MNEAKFFDAVDEGDAESVTNILSVETDLNKFSGERNALHRAAGYGHTSVVRVLISAAFNPLLASHTGRIPLHEACQGGHVEVVQELLKYGGVETSDSRGQSPLHTAAYHGESGCVKLLCSGAAQIACRDENHRTPAHLAAIMNQSETLHWLLEYGADIDMPDVYGRTCSHYAATVPDTKSLKTLLDKGVDLQVRCLQGRLPLHYSVTTDRLPNLQLLLSQHMKGHSSEKLDPGLSRQGRINLMLNTDNSGKCLAHIAAQNGSINCLHWMLEQGLNPDICDNIGNTPLHNAAGKSKILAYSCLLYHHADQNLLNDKGETPMDIARRIGKPFAIGKASQKKCPRCKQKGLDQEWELRNAPSDIIIAIESTKDLLFDVPLETMRPKPKGGGSTGGGGTGPGGGAGGGAGGDISSNSNSPSSSTSSLPKRNIAARYYGNFL